MKCPKCGNDYCRLESSTKTTGKDYSVGRGLIGEAIFGSSGYILGFSDSRKTNVDVFWLCPKCRYKFKA